jgi:hypothetical protein
MSEDSSSGILWEAPEHRHVEKGNDWYWAVGIIAVAATAAAVVFGNTLFGVVILLGAVVMLLFSKREPRFIQFGVTARGIQMHKQLFPYSTLVSYYIDEEHPDGPQLFLRSDRLFLPILVLPIPEEYTEEIEGMLASRLDEEFLEEPLAEKILEFFGF